MNYTPGGYYQPPENGSQHSNNGFGGPQNFYPGQKIPHFVFPQDWAREKLNIRRLSITAAVTILAFIAGSAVMVALLQGMFSFIFEADTFMKLLSSAHFTYLFEILYSIFIVGGPFFIAGLYLRKKGFLHSIPMEKPKNAKYLPLIIFGGFGLCLAGNIITGYIDVFVEAITGMELKMPEMPATPKSFSGIFLFYLSTAVVPALIEEMALRGIIMQSLRRYGDSFAIISSALIFGLMHCNLMQIPFAFLAGIVIGYAVVVTESIWTGIIIHFLNNAFTVTVSIINDFYGLSSVQYSAVNVMFYLLIVAGCVCAFVYLKKFRRPIRKSPLVNSGHGFAPYVPPYSEKISEGTLVKAYLLTAPMVLAYIAVFYQTIATFMLQ